MGEVYQAFFSLVQGAGEECSPKTVLQGLVRSNLDNGELFLDVRYCWDESLHQSLKDTS